MEASQELFTANDGDSVWIDETGLSLSVQVHDAEYENVDSHWS